MKNHASLIQLTKQDAITKTSETIPVKGELSNAHIIASTGTVIDYILPKIRICLNF